MIDKALTQRAKDIAENTGDGAYSSCSCYRGCSFYDYEKAAAIIQSAIDAAVEAKDAEIDRLRAEVEEAKRERDIAIAHDRQPYPTVDAYEKVCAARTKWQKEAERLRAEVEKKDEALKTFLSWWRRPNIERTIESIEPAMRAALAATEKE